MIIGLDFGTSNTAVGYLSDTRPQLLEFQPGTFGIPSAVFIPEDLGDWLIGHDAINAYEAGEDGRLLRSIKSVLGTSLIEESTQIGRRRIAFTEIVFKFIQATLHMVEQQIGEPVTAVVHGRPVAFNDNDPERDKIAQSVLQTCLERAGVSNIEFLEEPIAAAFAGDPTVSGEKTVLVIDIGGGTSDFSIVKVGPRIEAFDVLGKSGVYVGGNDFDRLLSFHEICRLFGKDETLSVNGLPSPSNIYTKLSDWKNLNKMYARETQKEISWMRTNSPKSDGIRALEHLIKQERAHAYANHVEATKIALSHAPSRVFQYEMPSKVLELVVHRERFEELIKHALEKMDAALTNCLQQSGVSAESIDEVQLVGGSTFIPHVENMLTSPIRGSKLVALDRFGSVALGLANRARFAFAT